METLNIEVVLEEIEALLQSDAGRFSNYQELSPFLLDQYPRLRHLSYKQEQISLDAARYAWLKERYHENNIRVLEIGASLGYFCFSLARENNARIYAYEPIGTYAKVCQKLIKLMNIENRFSMVYRSVIYDDLDSLPEADLLIHLNVLHHAGCVYDQDLVRSPQEWPLYAINYLKKLKQKSHYLFFQVGNVWKGQALFSGDNAVSFVESLLHESGWAVEAVGLIENLNTLAYNTYSCKEAAKLPVMTCRRNRATNLVDYFQGKDCIASLPTGLAQRPLWFCKRR